MNLKSRVKQGHCVSYKGSLSKMAQCWGGLAIFDHLAEKVQSSRRIKAAVVLAMDGFVDRTTGALDWDKTQIYVPNEFVLKGLKDKRRGVFYFGASVNPYRKDAIQRLIQMKNEGAVLIKWIPSIMNIDPADPYGPRTQFFWGQG